MLFTKTYPNGDCIRTVCTITKNGITTIHRYHITKIRDNKIVVVADVFVKQTHTKEITETEDTETTIEETDTIKKIRISKKHYEPFQVTVFSNGKITVSNKYSKNPSITSSTLP